MVTLPPFVVFDTLTTLIPVPLSLDSTFPLYLDGLKLNVSGFALQDAHVAAAPVIDRTKRSSVKTPIALVTFFFIRIPP
jgi:hypothetical protein